MKTIIVGGGVAGMMAGYVSSQHSETVIIEKNEKPLKKLFITGKGRCNVTNASSKEQFLSNIVRNPKFFFSAFDAFSNEDAVSFFEERGAKLKLERGNRYFPESDTSATISDALKNACKSCAVITNCVVKSIEKQGEQFILQTSKGKMTAQKVILACGGLSYPGTGSTGDGFKFAKAFGHNIVEPKPALVSIKTKDDLTQIAGLSLKNVTVNFKTEKKIISEFGEMLFMPDGLTGPIILTLSSKINRFEIEDKPVSIDLKPALTFEQLDARILRDFESNQNKQFKNALDALFPKSLIPFMVQRSSVDGDKFVNQISKPERNFLTNLTKNLTFTIKSLYNIETAIITSGGVDVKEIDPKTMQSKIVSGLFFAGEMLDMDALTGGFNIQIALSTGYLAGGNT